MRRFPPLLPLLAVLILCLAPCLAPAADPPACPSVAPAELPDVGPVEVIREARYGGLLRLTRHPSDLDLLAAALRRPAGVAALLDPDAPDGAVVETFLAVLSCREGTWRIETVVALAPFELAGFYYDRDVGSLLLSVKGFEEYLASLDWDEAEFSLELNPEFPENVAAGLRFKE
jgi:hypothetical protein